MRKRLLPLVGLTSLMSGFLIGYGPQPAHPEDDPDLAAGKRTFQQYCASCHGFDAKGNGPAAKGLKPAPTNLVSGTLKYAKGVPATRQVIEKGIPKTAMPPWAGVLKEAQITALAKYLVSLRD